jgi:FkbM family methyltransferase
MGNTFSASTPAKGTPPVAAVAVKSPVKITENKDAAKASFNLKNPASIIEVIKRLLNSSKHTVEFLVVFFIVSLFLIGLFFATPPGDTYYDLKDVPPPPVWSRGIARPVNVPNSTVTDSFALLKNVGFNPTAILDIGAFSGEWSRSAEKIFPEAEFFLIESSESRREDLMKTGLSYMIATVGAKPETVDFYDIPGKKASSRFREQTEDFISDSPVKKVTYPLDLLMEGMPAISMMKIDTQGSELEVLKGAIKILDNVEVLYITVPLMRIHKGSPLALEILSFCQAQGFELLNYVDGDARGPLDALVHVDLTLAKASSPLFSAISEGIVLHEEILKQADSGEEEDRGR